MTTQRREFLLTEYGTVRDEITSRVRSRRQLITASVATTIAIFGYGFSSTPSDGSNTWTLASIPLILAFVIYEILRSDAVIYQAAAFLRAIEREFLDDDIRLGWESTWGGSAEDRAGIHKPTVVMVTVSYVFFAALAALFWGSRPSQLLPIPAVGLVGVYVGIYIMLSGYAVHVYSGQKNG